MKHPYLQEFDSGEEVIDIASKRFQTWVGVLGPQVWKFTNQQAVGHGFQGRGHDHQTLDGFLKIDQAGSDHAQKPVMELG